MSFRLKAATFAALALSAAAATAATDMSIASEASLTGSMSTGTVPVTIPEPVTGSPAQSVKPAVIFASPREVAQPIESQTVPASPPEADSLIELVAAHGAPEEVDGDMRCLAGAVYFESKGESLEGQLAVARVVINRARSGRFASSLCGVVLQRGQFSFVRGNAIPSVRADSRAWREAVAIAQIASQDRWDSQAEGALFFHARRVSPGWGKKQLASIDNHIFYR
ncbi:cell wall hydrolase [Sphingobium sp. AN641]|uniref:cell wall hydrolase n=1 Tax=Sphingobium sp. AN641 TaxID=3133443 RepID=UPI0030C28186